MRLRILATIPIHPLFEIIRTFVASTVAPAREATSAQAASRHPPWTRTLQVHFSFGVESPYTSSKRAPFRPAPFGFTPSSILDAWRYCIFAEHSERKGFLGGEYADVQGSLQLLTSSHLGERDKMLLRTILCGGVRKTFPVVFVERGMEMGIYFGSVPFPPPACQGTS